MHVKVHSRHVQLTEAIREWANRRVLFAIGQFGTRVRSVVVRLGDENGPKGGADQRCLMEARIASAGRVVAEEQNADLYTAVSLCADRLGRRVHTELDREKGERRSIATMASKERRR